MAFIAGLMLLDAPASALNNQGQVEGGRTDNVVAVKFIRTRQGAYPYVSAQAYRFWLRTSLEGNGSWKAAPIFRERKIAYSDGDPVTYWDDDLFGYMRASSRKEKATAEEAANRGTATSTELTRVSPFRMSTLVSLAPIILTDDFGVMNRHKNGDPVPHEHQFYRATLKGLFSLDLGAAGCFSYRDKAGFCNLDDTRRKLCDDKGLEHLGERFCYRMPLAERAQRVAALLQGMAVLNGGAKLALHYTDVTPAVVMAAVLKGGNNPLQYVIGADSQGLPTLQPEALKELPAVWGDQMLSKLYVGWVQGFHDAQRAAMQGALDDLGLPHGFEFGHPREVLDKLAAAVQDPAGAAWLA